MSNDMFDKPVKHESFGVVEVSRVSGSQNLFQSPHKHQYYMALRVKPAVLHRNLSNDYVLADNVPLVEVYLSEAQWSTMVSSAGMGGGTPCTINTKTDGKYYHCAPCPEKEAARKTYSKEMRKDAADAVAGLTQTLGLLEKLLHAGKANKGQIAAVQKELSSVQAAIVSGISFVMEQFEEHVDKSIESAKCEIEAAGLRKVTTMGLAAMAAEMSPEQKDALLQEMPVTLLGARKDTL